MARRKRTKRSNPGLAGLGVVPLIIGAATAAASLIPAVSNLFKSTPETPEFHFDPTKYAQDYAAQLSSQTQQALAQQQTKQKDIESKELIQSIEAQSAGTTKLFVYGMLAVAGVVGAVLVVRALRKRK